MKKSLIHLFLQLFVAGFLSLLLVSCANQSNSFLSDSFKNSPFMASYQIIQESLVDSNDAIEHANLAPQFSYIRVWFNDQAAILALGFTETNQLETWYSADKNVFKTRQGRYAGSSGLEYNWESVHTIWPAPTWNQLLEASSKVKNTTDRDDPLAPTPLFTYARKRHDRSMMEFNIEEKVAIYALKNPPKGIPKAALPLIQPSSLQWFVERILTSNSKNTDAIVAYYALENSAISLSAKLVFSQQCFNPHYCISWMPWSKQ